MSLESLECRLEEPSYLRFDAIPTADDAASLLLDSVTDYAIYLLDPQGRVLTWNLGARRLKGYTQEEVVGNNFSIFFTPEAVAAGLPEQELADAARDGRFEIQDWRVRKGGERFWALVSLTAIRRLNGELHGFAKITRDMTPQKMLEEGQARLALVLEERVRERTRQLEATADELRLKNEKIEGLVEKTREDLEEKELLLREVYHRVKNNLQVVQSLLKMGARTIDSMEGRRAIGAAVERVQVMAKAHERLYQTPGLSGLTLSSYLRDIAEGAIASNSDLATVIDLQIGCDELLLPLELAIPFGLLVNELVSNSLKHGLAQARSGTISIAARIIPGAVRLVIHDNGKGLPEDFDAAKCRSMGLKLAASLARQLGGRLEFSSNNGCQVEAAFVRLLPEKSRVQENAA